MMKLFRRAPRGILMLLSLTGAFHTLSAQADSGQALRLTLEEALARARQSNESVLIAEAAVNRSEGQLDQAQSGYYPQLTGTASYTRTLASQFGSLGPDTADTTSAPASCQRFRADPSRPIDSRVDSLESAVECLSGANPFASFGDLPFGQENQYSFGLQLTQNLFTGGRLSGQTLAARSNLRAAQIALTAAEAQLTLSVARAYFDALLSDRLFAIAEASLRQADSTYEQTKLAEQVGTAAEFDRLRALVARNNQRPVVIQRRAERDIAYLTLKQTMDLPAGREVILTSSLNDSTAAPVPGVPMILEIADLAVDRRAPVLQAEAGVTTQEGLLKAARAQRFPTLALTSSFVQFAYPSSLFPGADDFLTDWTVGLSLQLPIFTGGRISGEVQVARANLEDARQRLRQTREFAEMDAFSTDTRLDAAFATWEASAGTVQQARRAYEIAEIRFREGISTQLELSDARLQLQQSQANRAQAVRDLQLARVRAALLRNLPLEGVAGPPTAASSIMSTGPTGQ